MKIRNLIIIVNLILILGFINWSVVEKEIILDEGKLVLLELAPIDPRSLMQGDYMRLQYKITSGTTPDKLSKRGYFILKLNERGVASIVRIQNEKHPLREGEYALNYTKKNWSINLGAESYFFEEGQGEIFEQAKYGGLKTKGGKSLLVGLYDKNFNLLRSKP